MPYNLFNIHVLYCTYSAGGAGVTGAAAPDAFRWRGQFCPLATEVELFYHPIGKCI
jgi:hypothetical protein